MQQPIQFKQRLLGSLGVFGPFAPAMRPQAFLDRILIPRWYIDPGLAGGLNDGSSWANAFNSTTTAWTDAIAASGFAGNDFYVNAASNCSNASSQTYTFHGTAAFPDRIFSCSNLTNNPPQQADLGVGAQLTVTGNSVLTIRGYIYAYGIVFNNGSGASAQGINLANQTTAEQAYDSCAFKLLSTGSCNISLNATGANSKVTWNNCTATINGQTNCSISLNDGTFIWKNSPNAIQGTQNALASLFIFNTGNAGILICDSVDFIGTTGIASGKNLIAATNTGFIAQFYDCKINSGVLIGRPTGPQTVIDQITSDSGATNYKQQRDTYQGTLTADTTHYNNASDGATPISWQIVTTANAKPQSPFECIGISKKVAAGTYAASKIFITSSVPLLKTNDVWVDVQYLGASYALGSPATSFGAGSGSATLPQLPQGSVPSTLAPASPGWAIGSLGFDYQLAIPSFTTAVAGEVFFVVKVGRASLIVNVDPAVTVA